MVTAFVALLVWLACVPLSFGQAATTATADERLREATAQAQQATDEYAASKEFKAMLAQWRTELYEQCSLDEHDAPSKPERELEDIGKEIDRTTKALVSRRFTEQRLAAVTRKADLLYPNAQNDKSARSERQRYLDSGYYAPMAADRDETRTVVTEELYAKYGYASVNGKVYSQYFLIQEGIPSAIKKRVEAALAAKKATVFAEATSKLGLTRLGDEWLTLREAGQKLGDRAAALMNECTKYVRNADQGGYVDPSDVRVASKLADSLLQTASDFRQYGIDPDGSLYAQLMSSGIILKYKCRSSDYKRYEEELARLLQYCQDRNDSTPSRTTVATESHVLMHLQGRLLTSTTASLNAATATMNEVQEAEKTMAALLKKKVPKVEYTALYDGNGNTRPSLDQALGSFLSSGQKSVSGTLRPTGYGVKLTYDDGTVEEGNMTPSEFASLRSQVEGHPKDLEECEQTLEESKARAAKAQRRVKATDTAATGTLKQYEERLAFLGRLKDRMGSGSVLPQATTEQR